ncbi:hypothetical protein [Pseudomonas fluorescens]|uniref:hypothetical protein n=1 Tax=Pseudomonas fluorescens TaxID=294 RepID=UPI001CA720CE|nr:hypothetical protein [Pseudomonas fluorescens]MBY8934224.1 hypothetical protein [Pseudomonas fluorescens]
MPAPEDLIAKTPGEPLGTITPLASAITDASGGTTNTNEQSTAQAQAPVFTPKHRSGGVFYVIDGAGNKIGDFTGTKEEAVVEAQRLTEGGEPLVLDPERNEDRAALAKAAESTATINAATLKQPVLTADGWLCPEPPVKE